MSFWLPILYGIDLGYYLQFTLYENNRRAEESVVTTCIFEIKKDLHIKRQMVTVS